MPEVRYLAVGGGVDHYGQLPPPAVALDYVGSDPSSHLAIAGLGEVRPIAKPIPHRDSTAVWQWLKLKFGQRVLAKRRERPRPLDPALLPDERTPEERQRERRTVHPVAPPRPPARPTAKRTLSPEPQRPLFRSPEPDQSLPATQLRPAGEVLAAAIRRLEASRYEPKVLGETILELAGRPDGYELLVSLTLKIIEAHKRFASSAGRLGR